MLYTRKLVDYIEFPGNNLREMMQLAQDDDTIEINVDEEDGVMYMYSDAYDEYYDEETILRRVEEHVKGEVLFAALELGTSKFVVTTGVTAENFCIKNNIPLG